METIENVVMKSKQPSLKIKLSLCLTKHHATKTHCGSRSIAPRTFSIGTRLRRMISFMPRLLYPRRMSPWYPLDRRLGEPQRRSGRSGEKKSQYILRSNLWSTEELEEEGGGDGGDDDDDDYDE